MANIIAYPNEQAVALQTPLYFETLSSGDLGDAPFVDMPVGTTLLIADLNGDGGCYAIKLKNLAGFGSANWYALGGSAINTGQHL